VADYNKNGKISKEEFYDWFGSSKFQVVRDLIDPDTTFSPQKHNSTKQPSSSERRPNAYDKYAQSISSAYADIKKGPSSKGKHYDDSPDAYP
jgi:hypothetical protein